MALISLAKAEPSFSVTAMVPFSMSFFSMALSSRRSFFRPTRMIGTPGQCSCTSGIH
jgi:hypothetical protein